MVHREVHTAGNETLRGGFRMQGQGEFLGGRIGDLNFRVQRDLGKLSAAIGVHHQRAGGGVFIARDDYPVHDGHVQIREHVALGEGGDQELFRVPAVAVAVKGPIRRAQQDGQANGRNGVVAAVSPIR